MLFYSDTMRYYSEIKMEKTDMGESQKCHIGPHKRMHSIWLSLYEELEQAKATVMTEIMSVVALAWCVDSDLGGTLYSGRNGLNLEGVLAT